MSKTYLMREDKERCELRYLFGVDDAERITRVELILVFGSGGRREHSVYERAEDSNSLQKWTKTHIPKINQLSEKLRGMEPGSDLETEYLNWVVSEEGRNNENRRASRVEESEKTLVERLRVSNPIVRDAFNGEMTINQLFREYHLIPSGSGIGAPHLSPMGRMCGCSRD